MTLYRFHARRLAALVNACAAPRARKGAVALIVGLAIVPVILLVGLAVDFGFIAQARAQLDLAADTAALTAAKTAGATFTATTGLNADTLAQTQGQLAGVAWFCAQVGTIPDTKFATSTSGCPSSPSLSVVVTPSNNAFTATVSYSAQVTTVFHLLFGIQSVTVSNTSSAHIVANAYVDVTFLLDNSSSMLIAATASGTGTANGVATLQPLTAAASCPQAAGGYSTKTKTGTPDAGCSSAVSAPTSCTTGSHVVTLDSSATTLAGCYCAFACHWVPVTGTGAATFTASGGQAIDTETGAPNTSGTTQTYSLDYYGIARANGIQLRFDIVQSAVADAISLMSSAEEINSQFGAYVYEFNSSLTSVWPPSGDTATQGLADAAILTDCGSASSSGPCTYSALAAAKAITTPVLPDEADTNFPAAMTALTSQSSAALTATGSLNSSGQPYAGDGSTQAKAKRSLIIITDGIQDYCNPLVAGCSRTLVPGYSQSASTGSSGSAEGPLSANDCTAMKNLGYTIYVLYTTYYVPPPTSLQPLVPYSNSVLPTYVNASSSSFDLTTNLQNCATVPADFVQAASQTDIDTALGSMVKAALAGGATLTQ